MPSTRLTTWLRPVLMLLAATGILSLAACGGGSGAPNNPYAPAPTPITGLTVYPANTTAYAGVPVTLSVTGGVAPYTVLSSNPAVLPVPSTLSGNNLVLMANNVDQETPVPVVVRDSQSQPQTLTATVTVKPTVLLPNAVTITGSPACTTGGDLCSGATGTAKVTVRGPTGSGIPGRQVRFEVVQGNYYIISSNPATPQVQTLTVVTDANGDALVGIGAPQNVVSQLGVIRATEITSGMQITGQFTIVQQITGTSIVTTIPNGKTTITGPYKNVCSTGVRVTHYIFGGTPPYRITTNFPDAITIISAIVYTQGGGFDAVTNGSCFEGLTFAIVDANGFTVTSPPTIDNIAGAEDRPVVPPTLQVAPTGYGSAGVPVNCTGATFPFTITGKFPFSSSSSRAGTVLNPNPVTASPGSLSVSGLVGTGPVTITIGDANTPQQIQTATIYCQ